MVNQTKMTRLLRLTALAAVLIILTGGARAHDTIGVTPCFDTLFAHGKLLVASNPDSAITLFRQADSLIDNDNTKRAMLYRQMSNAYHYKDSFSMAVELNNLAIEIRNQLPPDSINTYETAVLHYNNTLNYQKNNNYKMALDEAEQAISLFEKNGDDFYLSIACDLAAGLYQQTGNIFRAQELTFKELTICEKMEDVIGITYAYDMLSAICETMEQYDQQLHWQKEALKIHLMRNDSVQIAQSYNNIGSAYINISHKGEDLYDKKMLDTALFYLKESLRLKQSFTEEQARQTQASVSQSHSTLKYWRENLLVGTLNNISIAYRNVNADSCIAYSQLASKYYKLLHDKYGYASSLMVMAELNQKAKPMTAAARRQYEEVIEISGKDNSAAFVPLLQKAYAELSTIYFENGNYRKAYLLHKESFRLKDSLTRESNIRDITKAEMRFEFDKQRAADSVRRQIETLRIEAEHQAELKSEQVRTRLTFYLAIIILLFSLVFFFYYRTVKENEAIKLKQRMLETERSLLRTQMNPHFIFNALNSVQSFITSNNQLDAVRFLSKFAKQMRMILDHSMQQAVPLSDELASLALYIDLEKARFNNRFDYRIDVDDNVEDELVNVPPMLIQPFVENAILHGLMHKTDNNGLIVISITDNGDNTLTCQITDNGVGRKAAAEIESKSERAHKSVGMQLTRDRLQDLNRKTKSELSYTITDLEDADGNPLGTQVTIVMPEQE